MYLALIGKRTRQRTHTLEKKKDTKIDFKQTQKSPSSKLGRSQNQPVPHPTPNKILWSAQTGKHQEVKSGSPSFRIPCSQSWLHQPRADERIVSAAHLIGRALLLLTRV